MTVFRAIWVSSVLAASALTAGCGKGPCGLQVNTLGGSVKELYDITVDAVRAKRVDEVDLTVEFFHGNDIVTKVVADTRSYAKGAKIPLTDGRVFRITEPPSDFPSTIANGSITFETELVNGAEVAGCFNVLFDMDDGSQRTLDGAFSAILEALGG